jgi:hypothetical protein
MIQVEAFDIQTSEIVERVIIDTRLWVERFRHKALIRDAKIVHETHLFAFHEIAGPRLPHSPV